MRTTTKTRCPVRETKNLRWIASHHLTIEDGDRSYDSDAQDAPQVRRHDRSDKVVNINTTTQLAVVLVKPDRFETAAEIADHLKDKRTVVLESGADQ